MKNLFYNLDTIYIFSTNIFSVLFYTIKYRSFEDSIKPLSILKPLRISFKIRALLALWNFTVKFLHKFIFIFLFDRITLHQNKSHLFYPNCLMYRGDEFFYYEMTGIDHDRYGHPRVGGRPANCLLSPLLSEISLNHSLFSWLGRQRASWLNRDIYIIQRRPTLISRFTSLLPWLLPAARGIGVPSLLCIIFYNTTTLRHHTMRTINTR